MQRGTTRTGGMATRIVTVRPPKPPCWRDFVTHGTQTGTGESDLTDLTKIATTKLLIESGPDGNRCAYVGNQCHNIRSGKLLRRMRAKIHRTRSQFAIDDQDLPGETMTISLAETKPKEFGLRKQLYDDRIYMEENTRRCQSWLSSIEACEPWDDVAVTQDSHVDGEGEVEGVDVEIPDHTLWDDDPADIRPPYNLCASSSDNGEINNDSSEKPNTFIEKIPQSQIASPHVFKVQNLHPKSVERHVLISPVNMGLE